MIRNFFQINYPCDPQRFYDFSPYLKDLSGISLYIGFGAYNTDSDTNFKVRFEVEYPNNLYLTDDRYGLNLVKQNDSFNLVLHICPYMCKYLNSRFNTNKYVPVFFPLMSKSYIEGPRPIPVFYSGSKIPSLPIYSAIEYAINKYTGVSTVKSLQNRISSSSSYYDKLDMYAETKICIAHAVLSRRVPNEHMITEDSEYSLFFPWHTNGLQYLPQIKSRVFEGAMMGCILLVFKDEYKLIGNFFTENEDFIYFENQEDLCNKIELILSDYDKYKYLAVNAKKKFYENYTMSHFVDIIKSEYMKRTCI